MVCSSAGPLARPRVLNVELVNLGDSDDYAVSVTQGGFVVAVDHQTERDVIFRQALFIGAAGVKNRVHCVRFGNVFSVFQIQHLGASVCVVIR